MDTAAMAQDRTWVQEMYELLRHQKGPRARRARSILESSRNALFHFDAAAIKLQENIAVLDEQLKDLDQNKENRQVGDVPGLDKEVQELDFLQSEMADLMQTRTSVVNEARRSLAELGFTLIQILVPPQPDAVCL